MLTTLEKRGCIIQTNEQTNNTLNRVKSKNKTFFYFLNPQLKTKLAAALRREEEEEENECD